MAYSKEIRTWIGDLDFWATVAACVVAILMLVVATLPARGQTYKVLHNFTGCDGYQPMATLALRGGNLYGTAQYGYSSCGTSSGLAFVLKRAGSGWVYSPIHAFTAPLGGDDGAFPINYGGLTVGPDGSFYGTSEEGGIICQSGTCSMGVVFKLSPPPTSCLTALCPWKLTVLHKFADTPDGSFPNGNVVFDAAGNLYGTTTEGGQGGILGGTVYELTPSGGGWTETIIHSFVYPESGSPNAGVILDTSGNLYGTATYYGASSYGAVFQLTPNGSGWTANTLYSFTGGSDGRFPVGGLVMDEAGNLYGTTSDGEGSGGGTVFELTHSNGQWTFQTIHSFAGYEGPQSSLTIDSTGNLYGTTIGDGAYGVGNVFKLAPVAGGWTYSSLYDFTGGSDGGAPVGGVVLDANGNLYGTNISGGAKGLGVIFELMP